MRGYRVRHTEIAAFVKMGGWKSEAMERFKCDEGTVRRALKSHGVSLPKKWSIYAKCCKNPECPHTKDGATSKEHGARGYCKSCSNKMRYAAMSPKQKEEKRRRDKANRQANPDRQERYRQKWAKKHPYRAKATNRNQQRLNRADFDHAITVHTEVTVPWSNDHEGAPRPLRVVKRYVQKADGRLLEAMADLSDGCMVYKGVPLKSCSLFIETSKNTR